MPVRLSDVRYPSPGTAVYRGLTLTDPETGEMLATANAVEATWLSGGLSLVLHGTEVREAAVPRLRRLVSDRLQFKEESSPTIWLKAAQVKWQQESGSHLFADFQSQLDFEADGPQLQLSFAPVGEGESTSHSQSVWCSWRRPAGDSRPRLICELDTGGRFVSCEFLSALLEFANPLGDKARFCGGAVARSQAKGWAGELSGTIESVALHDLLPSGTPHRLEGTGKIAIKELRFAENRLVDARGSLSSGAGLASQSLIDSLCASLCVRRGQLAPIGDMASFDQLAVNFSLDARGVQLLGACQHFQTGVVAADGGRALLAEPARQPQPLTGLIKALDPSGDALVPANPTSGKLLQILPFTAPPQTVRTSG